MKWLLPAVLAFLAAVAFAATPIEVTPLTAADIPALLRPPARGERIVMLWSLDCLYCEPNMQKLAKLQRAHPRQVGLVTVATDSIAQRAAIAARLHAAGMEGYAASAYAAATPARFNFLIDPDWGGELPRTIVIHADGTRTAASGVLTAAQLERMRP